ncbi:MAG TPA: baseplate J/gp47 family protein [Chloroflexota bacterium]|nr:baseplate J/gp47 family protein [Chloroflexota bacterium]
MGERSVPQWRWVAGLVPVGILVGTLLYPHASVTLVPVAETTVIEVPLTVDPNAKKADAATGTLPGRAITKELSDSLSGPVTGRRTVPDAKASGEVVLLNRAETPVSVPKGTVVLAGPARFATQSDVTVAPSRRAGNAPIFGMVTVKVQAVTGGPSGNVDRNKIDKIEGPLSSSLSVQNNQPIRGGTERAATFVTEDDRKKLQEQLYRTLADRLAQQVKKDLPTSDKESLIAWSGQNPAIVEAVFSRNAEEEAPNVSLTLKVRYGATAFSNDAYNQLVRDVTARGAVPAKPGYRVSPQSVQAEAPSLAGAQNGVVHLVGRVRATITTDVDTGKLQAELAGKPVAAARAYLAELPGIQRHEVHAVNFLPGKMPLFGWRIGVSARPAT